MKHGMAGGPVPGWVMPPGAFRLALAMAVFVNHTIPLEIGTGAVYLFFMLSGYWVFRMWQREYRHTRAPVFTFLVSRAWRLLPMYYVGLAVLIAVMSIGAAPGFPWQRGLSWTSMHFYASHAVLLFYARLPVQIRPYLPVWSLDIELQFYIVAPLLIALLQGARVRLAGLLIAAVAVAGFADFLMFYGSIRAQSGLLPMYLVFFLIGLQTARTDWRPAPRLAAAGAILAGALLAGCLAVPGSRPLLVMGSFSGWLSDYNPDANVVLALLLAPYAMSTLRQGGLLPQAFDRHLGNITYDVYLLHWSAATALMRFAGDISTYRRLPLIVTAWVVVPLISAAVYFAIDRPIDRLRSRFVRGRMLEIVEHPHAEPAEDVAATPS